MKASMQRSISTTGPVAGPGPSSLRRCVAAPTRPSTRVQRLAPIRASDVDNEQDFEKRLKKLVKDKKVPKGDAKPEPPAPEEKPAASAASKKPTYDFTDEKVYYEGPPHRGDLAVNLALGTTLVWLPLTIGAMGRAAFVKYRFTDRRFSVMTTAPWKNDQIDVAYQEVDDVVTVGRGVGIWGDMVVTLKNKDKVELRSLERFKELKEYILERRDALAPAYAQGKVSGRKKGEITAAELMGEEPGPTNKGFGKN